MQPFLPRTALVVGVGSGLGAALARRLARAGVRLILAARDIGKLEALCAETGAEAVSCDASDPAMVEVLFRTVDERLGELDLCIYNAGLRLQGRLVDLDHAGARRAIEICALGGFLVGQAAARRMLPRRRGCLLFTGATASLKGFPRSAAFAMGKFALRGLCQSMARELHPEGIHVVHVVLDGAIRTPAHGEREAASDSLLDPAAVAEVYWQLATQDRSAWTDEIVLRPWLEPF
ncbi:putative oxidoreductase [bacterium HR40]|nr:putative oxidoreductase [bacterium HR40]